jgi:hypothetical protein
MRATKVLLTLILTTLVVINVYSLGHVIVNKALAKRQSVELSEPGIIDHHQTIFIDHHVTAAHQEERHILQHVPQPIIVDFSRGAKFQTFQLVTR